VVMVVVLGGVVVDVAEGYVVCEVWVLIYWEVYVVVELGWGLLLQ